MQLFITEFENKWNSIKISDKEILDQVRKVLRMKIWDIIFVQNGHTRHKIQIDNRDNQNIFWTILETIKPNTKTNDIWMIISMSNKRDKIELIVQKLSEIWISNIYFWPSERSIIRERNEKKLTRMNKIAKEATEQSWWRFLPKIEFTKDISKIITWKNVIIFDKKELEDKDWENDVKSTTETIGIIWPEWGFSESDYKHFWNDYKILSLGDTVLRTETAAIIASRFLKNIQNNFNR